MFSTWLPLTTCFPISGEKRKWSERWDDLHVFFICSNRAVTAGNISRQVYLLALGHVHKSPVYSQSPASASETTSDEDRTMMIELRANRFSQRRSMISAGSAAIGRHRLVMRTAPSVNPIHHFIHALSLHCVLLLRQCRDNKVLYASQAMHYPQELLRRVQQTQKLNWTPVKETRKGKSIYIAPLQHK